MKLLLSWNGSDIPLRGFSPQACLTTSLVRLESREEVVHPLELLPLLVPLGFQHSTVLLKVASVLAQSSFYVPGAIIDQVHSIGDVRQLPIDVHPGWSGIPFGLRESWVIGRIVGAIVPITME